VFDSQGRLLAAQEAPYSVYAISPGGSAITQLSAIRDSYQLAIGPGGRIYSASLQGRIDIFSPDGTQRLADDFAVLNDGAFLEFAPDGPFGGYLYAFTFSGRLLRINSIGEVQELGQFQSAHHLAFGPDGNLYLSDFDRDRILRITPPSAIDVDEGNEEVVLQVTDPAGGTAIQQFRIDVHSQSGNTSPVITTTPITTLLGNSYAYDVNALDGDGDELTYALRRGPDSMSISNSPCPLT
jgi:hypothetical protein